MRRINKRCALYLVLFVSCLATIQGCANQSNSRYKIKQDTAPTFHYGDIQYQEIIPVFEPYNIWTSRPYEVLGQYYTPLITGKGHEEIGNASWYGQKFHGHKTANGEIFDMFALTAAHKTLPLPSFVKVTNLENNEVAVVRVNDRGPFHEDRVLDLSYGAAKKLGFHQHGIANIKLEVIHVNEQGDITIGAQATEFADQAYANTPDIKEKLQRSDTELGVENSITPNTAAKTNTDNIQQTGIFVQVMAIQNEDKVKSLAMGLSQLLQVSTSTPKEQNMYKLQLGPLKNEQKAQKIIQELYKIGFEQAFTVQIAP